MAGNWKMYKTPSETVAFFEKFRPLVAEATRADIVICPPFVNLPAAAEASRGTRIQVGAQNLYWAKEGAFTGEVSAGMLVGTGCRWVIVAHSERREYFHETEASALKKVHAALEAGLTPIYCVGERLHERENDQTHEVLSRQLRFMDSTAVSLCMDNDLPIVVFDLMGEGNVVRAVRGERIGTLVSRSVR